MHCIQTHDAEPQPLTLEANIVAVGDGSDMSKGRGRLPFDRGRVSIHTVSALSIKDVNIEPGPGEKVKIVVELTNSAGIHQLEKVLGPRLSNSIASRYFLVEARTIPTAGPQADERIIHTITMEGKKLVVK